MRRTLAFLLVACSLFLFGCPSDSTSYSDTGDEGDAITAEPIKDYEVVESHMCVGLKVLPQYAEYDKQCQDITADCVEMENPQLGNTFYCALCGLKGTKKLCYSINPE